MVVCQILFCKIFKWVVCEGGYCGFVYFVNIYQLVDNGFVSQCFLWCY